MTIQHPGIYAHARNDNCGDCMFWQGAFWVLVLIRKRSAEYLNKAESTATSTLRWGYEDIASVLDELAEQVEGMGGVNI